MAMINIDSKLLNDYYKAGRKQAAKEIFCDLRKFYVGRIGKEKLNLCASDVFINQSTFRKMKKYYAGEN
jgi:hypothetical protein